MLDRVNGQIVRFRPPIGRIGRLSVGKPKVAEIMGTNEKTLRGV